MRVAHIFSVLALGLSSVARASVDGLNNAEPDLRFRFAFSGGMSLGNAELGQRTALTPSPESAVYGANPVSGSYRASNLISLRTMESVFLPRTATRDLVLGVGLDVQTHLLTERSYTPEKGIPLDLEAYALALEGGLRKRLWGLQSLEILGGIDWVLLGKTKFAYRAKNESMVTTDYMQEDKLGLASFRVALRGRYMLQFVDFLSAGLEVEGALGRYAVASRADAMWTQSTTLRGVFALELN